MSSEFDISANEIEYWVAIQPSRTMPPNVFGPYTRNVATVNRTGWINTYPKSAKISSVFRAASREMAEANAEFYMPKQ